MSEKVDGGGVDNSGGRRKWKLRHAHVMYWGILLFHFLCLFAPFTFTWPAFWVSVALYFITGFGITLSYHRNLAHRSFDLPKWLEYSLAYCGALAAQRDPIFWVSTHRHHHQFVDTERDPHSPILGFWFSHMAWLFNGHYAQRKYGERKNVEDLKKQAFYSFMARTYYLHLLAFAVVLFALGGFPFFVWGWGVRTVAVYHSTFLVNSACHVWGKQRWNTGDLSKNNWFVGWIALGEGWHNNHHAFEFSARQGLEWWEFDSSWCIIRFLQAIGLATNVKVPTEAQKKKRSFSHSVHHK